MIDYVVVVQITISPTKADTDVLSGLLVMNGAILRFPNHKTHFTDEAIITRGLGGGLTFFVMAQTQFKEMYHIVKGDDSAMITRKMTTTHNQFFSKLSEEERVIYQNGKSQRMIAEFSNNKIDPVPYIGMVRM